MALKLSNLDFKIIHISESLNQAPHILSRNSSDGLTVNEDQLKENLLGVLTSCFTTHSFSDRLFSLINHRGEPSKHYILKRYLKVGSQRINI